MSIVVLVVLALIAGLAVGYARHGRLRRLAQPPPVRNRLLLTALGLYILAVFASWAWESALGILSALSWFVVAFYAWLNRWMPGARLIALGLCANALVLLLNGSVPVSADAAARAGVERSTLTEGNTQPADDSTRLALLAKNVPVAFPNRPEVVSPGDIAVAAGLAAVLATGMTGRRPATNVIPATRRRDRYAEAEIHDANSPPDDETAPADHDAADDASADDTPTAPGHAASAHAGRSGNDHPRARMNRQRRTDTTPVRRHANA
ncbi:DUF5317 family protein [Phytoactinopolyspora mesophila]|uniref:DUF5317 domain-containing protein n=1 Tax=Phytoactinopolyspora mesophila TaxID=2650750 RepID=A0A7K3MCB0_9ACTN|nr:DUF5317 family protein [Phytoactinopolyspora mesophila]NDL60028.1 hypothetical protein [Phytoactinopolyspora mesophila]